MLDTEEERAEILAMLSLKAVELKAEERLMAQNKVCLILSLIKVKSAWIKKLNQICNSLLNLKL